MCWFLSGSMRSSASIQQVFCRSCSTGRSIFDVFVGRKMISTSYSSTILRVSPRMFVNIHKVTCLDLIEIALNLQINLGRTGIMTMLSCHTINKHGISLHLFHSLILFIRVLQSSLRFVHILLHTFCTYFVGLIPTSLLGANIDHIVSNFKFLCSSLIYSKEIDFCMYPETLL